MQDLAVVADVVQLAGVDHLVKYLAVVVHVVQDQDLEKNFIKF